MDQLDPWCACCTPGRGERIEAGLPPIDFPFETLADCLAEGIIS